MNQKGLDAVLRAAANRLYSTCRNTDLPVYPHSLLVEVLTRTRIEKSLSFDLTGAQSYSIDECVTRICGTGGPDELGRFSHVFATLILCKLEQHIFQFFESEVDNSGFPFRFKQGDDGVSGCLRPKSTPHLSNFPARWSAHQCEQFVNTQWGVFLPIFDSRPENSHQTFAKKTIMPWYDCHTRANGTTSSTEASSGGGMPAPGGANSDVSRVIIYDGHHRFGGLEQVSQIILGSVPNLKTRAG